MSAVHRDVWSVSVDKCLFQTLLCWFFLRGLFRMWSLSVVAPHVGPHTAAIVVAGAEHSRRRDQLGCRSQGLTNPAERPQELTTCGQGKSVRLISSSGTEAVTVHANCVPVA